MRHLKYSLLMILLLILSSAMLLGAAESASVEMRGSIPDMSSITVIGTTQPGTAIIDLSRSTNGYEPIGYLVERSNSPTGYTVTMSALNNFSLRHTDPTFNDVILYELQYNNNVGDVGITWTGSFWSGDLVYTITDADGPTGPEGVTKVMKIKYSQPAGVAAGTYSDTLQFTITAK